MNDFPTELIERVFQFFSQPKRYALRRVASKWNAASLHPRFAVFESLVVRSYDDPYISDIRIRQFLTFVRNLHESSIMWTRVKQIIIRCASCKHHCRCDLTVGDGCTEQWACQYFLDLSPSFISVIRSITAMFTSTPPGSGRLVHVLEYLSSDCSHRVAYPTKALPPCGVDHENHRCVRAWLGLHPALDREVSYLLSEPENKNSKGGPFHWCEGNEADTEEWWEPLDLACCSWNGQYMVWRVVGPWLKSFEAGLAAVQRDTLDQDGSMKLAIAMLREKEVAVKCVELPFELHPLKFDGTEFLMYNSAQWW